MYIKLYNASVYSSISMYMLTTVNFINFSTHLVILNPPIP